MRATPGSRLPDPPRSLYSEIVQPGRKHHHPDECFGATVLSLATTAARPGGAALFAEKLLIEPFAQSAAADWRDGRFRRIRQRDPCTPADIAERIHERVDAEVDLDGGVACGACRLPNDGGLVYKVLGRETAQVKAKVREFWELARREITGADDSAAVLLALAP